MRRTVGARELKTRLGTYLRHVQQGVTLIVTDRGRPVAELRPISIESQGLEARLEELATVGKVSQASGRPPAKLRPIRSKGPPLSQVIVDDRKDRL